jgi:SAM-dependent methyltransferase
MRRLEANSWWNAGMRDIAEKLLAIAGLPSSGAMLDVGCGSGQTMAWFQEMHPGWSTCGIDVAPEGVEAAAGAGLNAIVGSGLDLPFEPDSYDLVITLDVLQHLPLPDGDETCLREIARVLRPGGWLFIRTNSQAFPRTLDDPANNFRKYTPPLLRSKLESTGFRVARVSRANALLGLAEVPRELRATRREGEGYHGILAVPPEQRGLAFAAKRAVLRSEASLIQAGLALPLGRSIVALCRKPK